MSFETKFEVMN